MLKDILKGIALACAAAYLFGILFTLVTEPTHLVLPEILLAGLQGLLLTLWLFIPVGVVLGVLIPRLFAGHNAAVAFFGGIILGIFFGLAGGLVLAFLSGNLRQNFIFTLCMGVYCALWSGIYACVQRGNSRKADAATTQTD
jgi:hypothetical protein